jgi:hypothetical protein
VLSTSSLPAMANFWKLTLPETLLSQVKLKAPRFCAKTSETTCLSSSNTTQPNLCRRDLNLANSSNLPTSARCLPSFQHDPSIPYHQSYSPSNILFQITLYISLFWFGIELSINQFDVLSSSTEHHLFTINNLTLLNFLFDASTRRRRALHSDPINYTNIPSHPFKGKRMAIFSTTVECWGRIINYI